MRRSLHQMRISALRLWLGLAIGASAWLVGCTPSPVIDRIPDAIGGLPEGAPARPAKSYGYPAVHDMPPQRTVGRMSDDELVKMERELRQARDRLEGKPASSSKPAQNPASSAKNRPLDLKSERGSGATQNP